MFEYFGLTKEVLLVMYSYFEYIDILEFASYTAIIGCIR